MNQVAPARRLAAFRILTGGFALVFLVSRFLYLVDLTRIHESRWLPPLALRPLDDPPSQAVALVILGLTLALGVAYAAGWRFRATGPAFAVGLLAVMSYRNAWGHVFHTDNLVVLHVFVVGLAPSADAWALDARARPEPVEDVRYGFPLRLAALITVLTYVVTGVAKLRYAGGDWLAGDTLLHQIAFDNARKNALGDDYSPLAAARDTGSGSPVAGRRARGAAGSARAQVGGVVVGGGVAVPRRDLRPHVDRLPVPAQPHRLRPVLPHRASGRLAPRSIDGP